MIGGPNNARGYRGRERRADFGPVLSAPGSGEGRGTGSAAASLFGHRVSGASSCVEHSNELRLSQVKTGAIRCSVVQRRRSVMLEVQPIAPKSCPTLPASSGRRKPRSIGPQRPASASGWRNTGCQKSIRFQIPDVARSCGSSTEFVSFQTSARESAARSPNLSSGGGLGIHEPRSNAQGRARIRAKCPAVTRNLSHNRQDMVLTRGARSSGSERRPAPSCRERSHWRSRPSQRALILGGAA